MSEKVIRFWSFIFPGTYIYYRSYIYIYLSLQEEIVQNNFLMGVKFWRRWRNFREFSKTPSWREFLKNVLKSNILEKLLRDFPVKNEEKFLLEIFT